MERQISRLILFQSVHGNKFPQHCHAVQACNHTSLAIASSPARGAVASVWSSTRPAISACRTTDSCMVKLTQYMCKDKKSSTSYNYHIGE